ncbi:MAG TPA: hypothetical protein VGA25_06435 [Burkholderiales bacterium]
MKPPFHLVPDELSTDTVEVLEELLDEARKRRIIGIAFAVMYRNQEYIVNTAGEARRNPTFTRGMIAALDDRLSEVATSR